MTLEGGELFATGGLPQMRSVIGGASEDKLAIGGKGHTVHSIRMTLEGDEVFAIIEFP
jgi:hypothetical protein